MRNRTREYKSCGVRLLLVLLVGGVLLAGTTDDDKKLIELGEVRELTFKCDGEIFVVSRVNFQPPHPTNYHSQDKVSVYVKVVGKEPNQRFLLTPVLSPSFLTKSIVKYPKLLMKGGQVVICKTGFRTTKVKVIKTTKD